MAHPTIFDLTGTAALVTGASSGLGARFRAELEKARVDLSELPGA